MNINKLINKFQKISIFICQLFESFNKVKHTMPNNLNEQKQILDTIDEFYKRSHELESQGFELQRAMGMASLEKRIKYAKETWGENLNILIYGGFQAPLEDYRINELGIIIHSKKIENSIANSSVCALKATVEIDELNVSSLIDATKRINVFLGTYTLVTWGQTSCNWWSWVTHGGESGVIEPLIHQDLVKAINDVKNLNPDIRSKVNAALYWIRDANYSHAESHRSNVLKKYVSYWNAFECLVEAINIVRPLNKLSKIEKQNELDNFLKSLKGKPTTNDISDFYSKVINPGFRANATNALNVIFDENAQRFIDECFNQKSREDNLYQVRNSINHGDIDAENLDELIRVDARMHILWGMVWGMFGRLIPFPTPII